MPQIAPLVLTDRSTTPVATSFEPVNIAQPGSIGQWSSNSPNLENAMRLTTGARRTTTKKVKSKTTLAVPVISTHPVTGQPVIDDIIFVSTEITSATSTSDAARNNALGMHRDALSEGKTVIHDVMVKGRAVY